MNSDAAPPIAREAAVPSGADAEDQGPGTTGAGADPAVDAVVAEGAPGDEAVPAGGGGQHVVRGSIWFVASVVFGAAFGMLFWVISARRATPFVVGVATSLWTYVQFMNYATSMGLPVAVAKYGSLPRRTVNSLFLWALLYTAVSSLAGTLLFVLLAPAFVQQDVLDALFRFGPAGGIALFFLLITGMSYAVLVEVRLITLRHWGWVFGRQFAIGIIRLPLLYLAAVARSPLAILLLIAGTPALSGFIGSVALRYTTPRAERGSLLPLPAETVPAFRFASVNYVGMLAAQAPQFVVPLIVTSAVDPTKYAPFYLAWLASSVVFIIPHTVGQVVLSESGRSGSRRAHQVRTGLKLSLGATVLATIGAYLVAPFVPTIFGVDYEQAKELLPRFVAASIPWSVTAILLARARVEANHVRTVIITLSFATLTLVPCVLWTHSAGIEGAGNAWLVGNLLAAPVAVLATLLVKPSRKADLVPSPART